MNQFILFGVIVGFSYIQAYSQGVALGAATYTPDGILHIDNGASDTDFILEKDDGTSADIIFHVAGTPAARIGFDANEDIVIENDDEDQDIFFSITDGAADVTVMRLDGSENMVGIGIAAPLSKLHVTGATGMDLGVVSSSTGSVIFNNSTNANTITIQSGVAAATTSVTLPAAQGSATSFLAASGTTAMQWLTYEDDNQAIAAPTDGSWDDTDLTGLGNYVDGSVVQILVENTEVGANNQVGVRSDGSAAARLVDMMEAEDGGKSAVTFIVPSSSTGIIEIYSDDASETNFYLIGYW